MCARMCVYVRDRERKREREPLKSSKGCVSTRERGRKTEKGQRAVKQL